MAGLRVGDLEDRRGIPHFTFRGKGWKIRYLPAHPIAVAAEVIRLPSGKGTVRKSIGQLTFFELCMVYLSAGNLAEMYHGGGNLEFGAEAVKLFHIFRKMPASESKKHGAFGNFLKRHTMVKGPLPDIFLKIKMRPDEPVL